MDLIWLLLGAALTVFPMWKLLERTNINPLWSLAAVTGIGLIVLLWVLAFATGRDAAGRN
jgi:hypothetical protein